MSLNFTFSFLIDVCLSILALQHSLPPFVFLTTTFPSAFILGVGGKNVYKLTCICNALCPPWVGAPLVPSVCSSTCPTLTRSATRTRRGRRCSGKSSPRSPGSCRCTRGQGMEVSSAQSPWPHIHPTQHSSTGWHSEDPADQIHLTMHSSCWPTALPGTHWLLLSGKTEKTLNPLIQCSARCCLWEARCYPLDLQSKSPHVLSVFRNSNRITKSVIIFDYNWVWLRDAGHSSVFWTVFSN